MTRRQQNNLKCIAGRERAQHAAPLQRCDFGEQHLVTETESGLRELGLHELAVTKSSSERDAKHVVTNWTGEPAL
jgi:hypothetical protein